MLTGLSGTGKTQLALKYAEALTGATGESNEQVCTIPVQPGWYDPTPLLGYVNPLGEGRYIQTEFLRFLIRASENPTEPHVCVLDEMNLSHPEQYLAPILSAMEREDGDIPLHGGDGDEYGVPPSIRYPGNFVLIGTVNMDETTMGISDKVLDRAFTLEFWDIDVYRMAGLGRSARIEASDRTDVREVLNDLMDALRPARLHFGWRVIAEVAQFMELRQEQSAELSARDALDRVIYAKVLPKLRGDDSRRVRDALEKCAREVLKERLPDTVRRQGGRARSGPEGNRQLPLLAVVTAPRAVDDVMGAERTGSENLIRYERERRVYRTSGDHVRCVRTDRECRLLVDDEPLEPSRDHGTSGCGSRGSTPAKYAPSCWIGTIGRWGHGRLDVSPDAGKAGRDLFERMINEIVDFDARLVVGEEPARRRLGALGETDDPLVWLERLRRRRSELNQALAAIRREPVSVLRGAAAIRSTQGRAAHRSEDAAGGNPSACHACGNPERVQGRAFRLARPTAPSWTCRPWSARSMPRRIDAPLPCCERFSCGAGCSTGCWTSSPTAARRRRVPTLRGACPAGSRSSARWSASSRWRNAARRSARCSAPRSPRPGSTRWRPIPCTGDSGG